MEEIDLKEIFKLFLEKKFLIIAVTILFAILGGVYSFYLNTPKYKATTTLVLTKTESNIDGISTVTEAITQTDVTLNQKLVTTYSKIIKSRTVLSAVINNLEGLTITEEMDADEARNIEQKLMEREEELREKEEKLKKNITVTAVEDSSVIEVSVVNENAEYAAKVANEIAKVFSEKVTEMYKINNVYTLDVAEIPSIPYNIDHNKYIAIAAVAGLVLACGYVFVINMFDNTTKNKEKIEKEVGAPVLVLLGKKVTDKKGGANA